MIHLCLGAYMQSCNLMMSTIGRDRVRAIKEDSVYMSFTLDCWALKLELCNLGMLNVIPMVTAKKIAEDIHKRKWEKV